MISSQRSLTNLSKLEMQVGTISSILKNAYGINGASILFDRNGSVYTTNDGNEILSILSFEDYLMKHFVRSIMSSSQACGDGTKLSVFIVHELLITSNKYIQYNNEILKRTKACQCLQKIQQSMLPAFFNLIIDNLATIDVTKNNNLVAIFNSMLSTKFSKGVSICLANLLATYFDGKDIELLLKSLKTITEDASFWIIEIPGLPIGMSEVVNGFVITRSFRSRTLALKQNLQKCRFILWSVDLSTDYDNTLIVPTASDLASAYSYLKSQLNLALKSLKNTSNISIVLSSVHIPEWAEGVFAKNEILFIDMIDPTEFEMIKCVFEMHEVTLLPEILTPQCILIKEASFESFFIGNKRYTKILINFKQILMCGSSQSHTRQQAYTCARVCRYLFNWINASNNEIKPETLNKEIVYSDCTSLLINMYQILDKKTLSASNNNNETSILKETLQGLLKIIYKSRAKYSDGKFIEFLHCFKKNESESSIYEDPFAIFNTLKGAFDILINLTRIENIIITKKTLRKEEVEDVTYNSAN